MPRVLVTGGTGLLGAALREVVAAADDDCAWVFAGRADGDLRDADAADALLARVRPTHVVHLAARVGGLFANRDDNLGFFEDNLAINYNVVRACRRAGVLKLVACLSTCVFADGAPLPLGPEAVHAGPPHVSNQGYAYAKRALEVHCRLAAEATGRPYVCVAPTNIYGPGDDFGDGGHVLAALVRRACSSATTPPPVRGTGASRRQFLYAPDAARLLVRALWEYDDWRAPLVLTPPPDHEVSIADLAAAVWAAAGRERPPTFDGDAAADGQLLKTASDAGVRALAPDFAFTPLAQGLARTVAWWKALGEESTASRPQKPGPGHPRVL